MCIFFMDINTIHVKMLRNHFFHSISGYNIKNNMWKKHDILPLNAKYVYIYYNFVLLIYMYNIWLKTRCGVSKNT